MSGIEKRKFSGIATKPTKFYFHLQVLCMWSSVMLQEVLEVAVVAEVAAVEDFAGDEDLTI